MISVYGQQETPSSRIANWLEWEEKRGGRFASLEISEATRQIAVLGCMFAKAR